MLIAVYELVLVLTIVSLNLTHRTCVCSTSAMDISLMDSPISSPMAPLENKYVTVIVPWLDQVDPIGRYIGSAFLVAMRRLKFNVTWALLAMNCNNEYYTISQVVRHLEAKTVAIVGYSCPSMCRRISLLCAAFDVPFMASGGCPESSLMQPQRYPTFLCMAPGRCLVTVAVLAVIRHFGWNTVSLLSWQDEDIGDATDLLLRRLHENKIETFIRIVPADSTDSDQLDNVYHNMKLFERHSYIVILLTWDSVNVLMAFHAKAKMPPRLRNRFVFIIPHFRIPLDMDLRNVMPKTWPQVKDTFHGSLAVDIVYPANRDTWQKFSEEVALAFNEPRFNGLRRIREARYVREQAGYFYNAFSVLASLLKEVDSGFILNGTELRRRAMLSTFPGLVKSFNFTQIGDEGCIFRLMAMQQTNQMLPIGFYDADNKTLTFYNASFTWPGGSRTTPRALPLCLKSECVSAADQSVLGGTGFAACVVILTMIGGGIAVYRHARMQVVEASVTGYLIRWDRIKFSENEPNNFWTRFWRDDYSSTKRSAKQPETTTYSLESSLNVRDPKVFQNMHKNSNQHAGVTLIGAMQGKKVAVRTFPCKSLMTNNDRLLNDLAQMKAIRHENLNEFIGVCVEAPKVCIMMRYAQKGSLHDLLQNDDVNLTLEFRFSFAVDIANGMEYLHQSVIQSHGHLSSSNCVIDNRWKCMVTDYGMGYVRSQLATTQLLLPEEALNILAEWIPSQLWMAPELLRMSEYERPIYGTRAGDIYSFGIILNEITTRTEPYGSSGLNYDEILQRVAFQEIPEATPFRPAVVICSMFPEEWYDLMTFCWDEDPDRRPTFQYNLQELRTINSNRSGGVVDKMLHFMEQHAGNMEELVRQRQAELVEEKKKVEEILFNMLPKSVVIQYVNGKEVPPELFESATIYFSDIDKFLWYSSQSTAFQMVELLNSIYVLFDEITDQYDVYKVEAINDEYMVASGLPIRNSMHAAIICTMAIHLLNALNSVVLSHLPKEKLRLRIGIHTGTVVGGMLGHKVPRYCLFGDTINTASRMMTSGLANRIQLSASTRDMLDPKEFIMEGRGEIDVKGKGKMLTFWLLEQREPEHSTRIQSVMSADEAAPVVTDMMKPVVSSGGELPVISEEMPGNMDTVDQLAGPEHHLPGL